MIGAIVLTLRHRQHIKRQNISQQVAARPKPAVQVVKVRPARALTREPRGQVQPWKSGISHYLTVSAILYTLGIFGIFLNRKNIIVILMSVELILLAVNINMVAFSAFLMTSRVRSSRCSS